MKKCIKIIVSFSLASLLLACHFSACNIEISQAAIGKLQLRMKLSDVSKIYPNMKPITAKTENQEPGFLINVTPGNSINLIFDEEDLLSNIAVEGVCFKTHKGVLATDNFETIRKTYPRSVVYYGFEESPYISVYIPSLDGYFSFETTSIPSDWFEKKHESFEQLNNAKSIMYFTRE